MMCSIIYWHQIILRGTLEMTQPFMEFLHSADAESIPDDMLGLGRKWLLDLLGVVAGATDTRMSWIMRDHVAEHFAPGQRKVPMLFDGRLASPGGAALAGASQLTR
jgi:hypothetical protein